MRQPYPVTPEKSVVGQHNQHEHLEDALTAVTSALADRSRSRMLCALMDGRAYTATELSAVADISPSTASAHLARLTQTRLIKYLSQGRHRYYRLAGPEVADIMERLMGLSWEQTQTVAIPIRTPVYLRHIRRCYDHLAGEVAVALYEQMIVSTWLSNDGTTLTPLGYAALTEIGVDCSSGTTRRRFACPCLDWSERRPHLGGQLGAAILNAFEQHAWVTRHLDSRGMNMTPKGKNALAAILTQSVNSP
ncbi:metalloregulator ArsR/SmtB family transcription factor [Acerihabitans sp. TG2]|uniref:ArsR/SmtB family transcription factor n=1 Tax=Acerihabitans sp. TG2 TaxID=3096008 RepID=UPI002B22FBCC|nr:metalloregulator ArsR/SmtB family transcription factor [Acerihabitans sp. TG2]MEA9392891.1 metalloregulator ArsR/SmtB family transcription factor [Acerihabitans sp. TG2]